MKWIKIGSVALLAFGFVGCDSLSELTDLDVVNQNNPDRARAIQEAGDIESLIAGAFATYYEGSYWGWPSQGLMTAGEEGTISWTNFAQQDLSQEPRVRWDNSPSYSYRNHNQQPWYDEYAALSAVYDALVQIEVQPELCEEIDCDRALAFGKFVQGLSHGWLGLFFDSAFIFDETVDLETDVLALSPYPEVMDAAYGYFAEALALANSGFGNLDNAWIFGNPLSSSDFAALIHSVWARYMFLEPRTPAERGSSVDWAGIISHVDQGIDDDLSIDGDGADLWWHAMIWYGAQTWNTTWTRADYKTIGWAESYYGTGNCGATAGIDCYDEWLALPASQRNDFILNTPDERIHAPGDGNAPGLDFQDHGPSRFPTSRGTYQFSRYMHLRYADYAESGGQAPSPFILYEEAQLMKAEALIRSGQGGAAGIINATRVSRGNLPALADNDPDILDHMIYEYRIENFFACPGCAFFTRRSWAAHSPTGPDHHQGLVEGTAVHWPMPGLEMDILQKLNYSYGGIGEEGGSLAPSGAPGFGTRDRLMAPASMIYQFDGLDTTLDKIDYLRGDGPALSRGAALLTHH